MSLTDLRKNCMDRFQERADAATTRAINMTIRPASEHFPAMTAEEYAMQQVENLATARAFLMASQIVTDEYRKLTQPEENAAEDKPKAKRAPY